MVTHTAMEPHVEKELQSLADINRDSAAGYHKAAELTEMNSLAALFETIARQRETYALDIDRALGEANHDLDDTSVGSTVHRWWMALKTSLVPGSEKALLREINRGEESLLNLYEELLPDVAGVEMTATLNEQYASIVRTQKAVERMLNTFREAA